MNGAVTYDWCKNIIYNAINSRLDLTVLFRTDLRIFDDLASLWDTVSPAPVLWTEVWTMTDNHGDKPSAKVYDKIPEQLPVITS